MPKGIHRVAKRRADGRVAEYHYAWRGGPRFWSSDDGIPVNGTDYWADYHRTVSDMRPSRGKFREVLAAYLDNPTFKNLAPRTQKDTRESIFHPINGIEIKFGDAPTAAFERPEIRRAAYLWQDAITSDRVADRRMKDLTKIVAWAIDRRFITHHHLQRMNPRYTVDRSDIIWTDDEITAFVTVAPEWVSRVLIAATETGLRPGDLTLLSRGHVQSTTHGQRIFMRTAKRKKVVSIPVTQRMAELIEATPKTRLNILATSTGQPFKGTNYMMKSVREWRRKAGIREELHLHDARGTAATRLFRADASLREISMHMGWSVQHTAKMIEIYVQQNPAEHEADLLLLKLQRSD
jgi:hypothetical protein